MEKRQRRCGRREDMRRCGKGRGRRRSEKSRGEEEKGREIEVWRGEEENGSKRCVEGRKRRVFGQEVLITSPNLPAQPIDTSTNLAPN